MPHFSSYSSMLSVRWTKMPTQQYLRIYVYSNSPVVFRCCFRCHVAVTATVNCLKCSFQTFHRNSTWSLGLQVAAAARRVDLDHERFTT